MKVFKFGGASVSTTDRIEAVARILQQNTGEKIMLVVSAMGKTTNALEEVTGAYYAGNQEEALLLFQQVKETHLSMASQLLHKQLSFCEEQLNDFFTEAEWLLHGKPERDYDYYYDQIVSTGELFSSALVSSFLNEKGIACTWIDVRDILHTNNDFRNASIDYEWSERNITKVILPLFNEFDFVLTQGFIGATHQNESTTLGREGSDYSAAIFAHMLDAECLTIWKDVPCVMNADPRQFADAVPMPELNYDEVIEMAYYGAQIIHPNTIKPLQNKGIPLYVKSFLNSSLPGTVIHEQPVRLLPPVIVLKEKQVMLEMSSRDFSFIGEHHVGHLYQLFEKLHIKPNLTQNGAIHFVAVLDDWPEKINKLAQVASSFLDVQITKNLSLLTIRHYNMQIFEHLSSGRTILLRQQTAETIQALMTSA